MDPYGVLGIRPSAGRDEIELAYKGRRSQYHPDRYAQSDAETQAWATGKCAVFCIQEKVPLGCGAADLKLTFGSWRRSMYLHRPRLCHEISLRIN